MRGVYTLSIVIPADSLNIPMKTLMYVRPKLNTVFEILGIDVTNNNQSVNEQLKIEVLKHSSVSTPTGPSLSIQKKEKGDAAYAPAISIGNITSSISPAYESQPLDAQGFPSLAGYHYSPLPEERDVFNDTEAVAVRLLTVPSASMDVTAEMRIRVLGG
jgi:hypothetical protein